MNSATVFDQAYDLYSYDDLGRIAFEISKQILGKNLSFDRIVALAKGGLTYSRTLVDYLAIEQVSAIQIELYSNINQKKALPVITQSLPVSIKGEKVLVFDDVVDTGETLQLASTYLQQHGAKDICTATLLSKPWSQFKPDFIGAETKAWVIFPNEIRESIELLSNNWQKMGKNKSEIQEGLQEIGFSTEEIELFS